ncbi:MAG TPA: cellulase-like family protein [Anaerolineales bacterium]|nr:cellulase-like family protein [Anaerolineales bacterium]
MNITPLAIAMWDFSWLERRWPGAGYEDWDTALDELAERGYNAVRIDAYPHLIAENPTKEWTLFPVWDQQAWGSPDINKVCVQPALNLFITRCKKRNIKVGLSTWYREDTDNTRMHLTSPEKMALSWLRTLEIIARDELLDAILYVDLCNEWPGDLWAPFFENDPPQHAWGYWHTDTSMRWMRRSIEIIRDYYPDLPLCYSFNGDRVEYYAEKDLSFFDLLEHHIWMVTENDSEFYKIIEYSNSRFSPQAYKNLVSKARQTYQDRPLYWQGLLTDKIERLALAARTAKLPLMTTEGWGVINYKDWPLLPWDWVKEVCELGVMKAVSTGQWVAIATSNFCGPQFVGMWRDITWHKRLTHLIRTSQVNEALRNNPQAQKLLQRV